MEMEAEVSRSRGDAVELGFLFLERFGDLVGIDLNKYTITSPDSPPPAPIRYRLDLRNNGFPIGMCHIKTKTNNDDHKLYLLGGAIFDSNQQGIDPIGHKGWVNYSDQVFEFDPSFLLKDMDMDIPKKILKTSSFIKDMGRNKEVIIPAKKVLKTVPNTMMGPKFALVVNLKGTFYAMNHWIECIIPCFKPRVPFERFDSNHRTWHEAPTPPLFYTCCKCPPDSDYRFNFGYLNFDSQFWNLWPDDEGGHIFGFPVYSYFVVDDKFLLFCLDCTLHVFHHGDPGEWIVSSQLFQDVDFSFTRCKKTPSPPPTGLWLSDFTFPHPDLSGFGVLLSIRKVDNEGYDRTRHPIPEYYKDLSYCFGKAYTVHAYSMSKTSFRLEFYQQLDEVFSGILPPPSIPLSYWSLRSHLLDLGCKKDDDQKDVRRICAILIAKGLTNDITYLIVSIFNLQMINSVDSSYSCVKEFLEVSVVKKHVFTLYDMGSSIHSYDDSNEEWMSAYNIPPLDPFIL